METRNWRPTRAVVVVLVLSVFAGGGGVEATPITVLSALSAPDETEVMLSGVVVDKVASNPPYIVVREPWSSEIRLIVLLEAPAEVQRWQTVDVTGIMTTLETDARAITASSVSVYKDTSGRTALMPLPVLPGDQSFTPEEAPLQLSGRGEQEMMDSEEPPEVPSGDPPPDEIDYHLATVGEALELEDGDTVELACKPITDTGTDGVDGAYYVIGDDDSSDEMRVFSVAEGDTDQRVVTVTGTIVYDSNDDKVLHVDRGPGTPRQGLAASVHLASIFTVAKAKTLMIGEPAYIAGVVVTAVLSQTEVFVQDPGAPVGLRVTRPALEVFAPGDVVSALGTMCITASGELYLAATETARQSTTAVPAPFWLSNKSLGGADWPAGAAVRQRGAPDGVGPNNVGLLVRTTGRVVASQQGLLGLDDGSCGDASCPVWVSLPAGVLPPTVGSYVVATGGSSLTGSVSAPERFLRVASAEGLQVICADDSQAPTVAISSPDADGPTIETFSEIQVAASDAVSVTQVLVRVDSGDWQVATYSAASGKWTVEWNPSKQDYSITARAYDCGGRMATTTRTVSLVDVEIAPGAPERTFLPGTVISWPAKVNAYPTGAAGGNGVLRKAPSSQTGYDWDAFTLARLKEASLGSLRFGDMATNHYNWRFGVGPKAERPPVWVPEVGYFSLHAYGIAEHVELAEEIGATPIVAVAYWNADESLAINSARNLVLFANAAYQGKLNTNWAVTIVNRHLSECGEYAERGYTLGEKVKRNTGDMTGLDYKTDPPIDLAFRCIQTYATHSEDKAPRTGEHWTYYWEAIAPTEEKPTTGVSYLTTDGIPIDETEAARWPQYWAWVRHELSARDTPLDITYWEIGNQIFSDGFDVEPEDYRQSLEDFRAAMTSADASIEVGACVPTWREAQYNTWPGVVLDPEPTKPYDFAVPHFYVGTASPTAGIDALFANTTPRISTDLDVYSEASSGLARIWSTEVNTRFGFYEGSNPADIPHNFRLKSALACAAAQLTLGGRGAMGSDVFTAAAVSNGTATSEDARDLRLLAVDQIKDTESGVPKPSQRQWVTPTYYVQKLLGHFAQENPIMTACASPVLVAQAFKTTDSLRLFIVNKDPEEARAVRVYLDQGINPTGPAVLYELSGTNGMESTNECGQGTQVHDPTVAWVTVSGNPFVAAAPAASMTVYDISLSLSPADLRGVVTDTEGKPIVGADVTATDLTPPGAYTESTTTDAFGVYILPDLQGTSYDLTVEMPGYLTEIRQVDFNVMNFTLTPRLSGTVKRPPVVPETEPQPVPGAAVWAVPSGGGDAITTVSDCDGNFVLPVAAGTYDVRADVAGDLISPRLKESVDVTSTSACISFIIAADATPGFCN